MKITCTQEEKDRLILIVVNSSLCVFNINRIDFCGCYKSCKTCLDEHIEWEIEGGEQDD